jgi:glutamate dehydrogenase/leucine dehydrogenase
MASTETQIDARRSQAGSGNVPRSLLAFEEAAALLGLEPWIVQRLRHPAEETTAYLQAVRDSGDAVCLPLFALRHCAVSGCAAGSLSLAPGRQQHDCRAMGMERTWQSALLGLPFGGAAYGLVCDPAEWSERELIAILPALARQLDQCGGGSILFPGEGCCREFMGRLAAHVRGTGDVKITGKPDCMGGLDHNIFAAEGIAALVSATLRHAGRAAIGAKVAIQGFGALGRAISQRLAREGMRIVALSDTSGGIYRTDGLILEDVAACLTREPILFSYKEAEHIARAKVLSVEADVLLLTSGANELNEKNCQDVAAEVIVEAEFDAISEDARITLSQLKVVMPWFLSTCGTLVGSYFELHGSQLLLSREELLTRCYGIVGQAGSRVLRAGGGNECSCEQAAYRLAIEAAASYLRSCGLGS